MKATTEQQTVTGHANRSRNRVHIHWIDPHTGRQQWAEGEFLENDGNYLHDVWSEAGNYLVKAPKV